MTAAATRTGPRRRRWLPAATVILCYHRVAEGVDDPFSLCVSPGNFEMQLKHLERRAELVTLDEVMGPSSHPRVAITFDDGYVDNLVHAAPIAGRLGVPMAVYVTSGMVGDPNGFWWDRLAHIVKHGADRPREIVATTGGESAVVQFGDPRLADGVVAALRKRLLTMTTEEIDEAIESLARELGVEPAAPPDARPLRLDELRRLSAMDHVTIGAHTTRHVYLRTQPYDAQVKTISASKSDLEAVLDVPVCHFAYPFGGTDSFDDRSMAAVRHAGFETATTTIAGSVGRNPEPLRLRRRLVMDWGPQRWRAQLFRWGLL